MPRNRLASPAVAWPMWVGAGSPVSSKNPCELPFVLDALKVALDTRQRLRGHPPQSSEGSVTRIVYLQVPRYEVGLANRV
jgi:hypothetical protein